MALLTPLGTVDTFTVSALGTLGTATVDEWGSGREGERPLINVAKRSTLDNAAHAGAITDNGGPEMQRDDE